MKHPKSENILKVIENFNTVLPIAMKNKKHLDMDEFLVKKEEMNNLKNSNHICNTTLCHGGWYAAAVWDEKLKNNRYPSYIDGAHIMAKDLGMRNMNELEEWAEQNQKIWGNRSGTNMFSHPGAFRNSVKRPNGAKTLKDIVSHWKEVYQRVKKEEQKQK